MTATPIPRTLALTVYGDLDVSVLDELPPGRQPIKTMKIKPTARERAYNYVRAEVGKGHQAYVVCPLVEESEKLANLKAATAVGRVELRAGELNGLRVGLVHGQMDVYERDEQMELFRQGMHDVLVSTTVIEVGVDVPNATVMLIEDADRFGLSQLHQLRGRVGRGPGASKCILLADPKGDDGKARLNVMVKTQNGFEIAEHDLQLRGPGEFYGTRQSGMPDFRLAELDQRHRSHRRRARGGAGNHRSRSDAGMAGASGVRARVTTVLGRQIESGARELRLLYPRSLSTSPIHNHWVQQSAQLPRVMEVILRSRPIGDNCTILNDTPSFRHLDVSRDVVSFPFARTAEAGVQCYQCRELKSNRPLSKPSSRPTHLGRENCLKSRRNLLARNFDNGSLFPLYATKN